MACLLLWLISARVFMGPEAAGMSRSGYNYIMANRWLLAWIGYGLFNSWVHSCIFVSQQACQGLVNIILWQISDYWHGLVMADVAFWPCGILNQQAWYGLIILLWQKISSY